MELRTRVNEEKRALTQNHIDYCVVSSIQGDPYVFSPYSSHERACAATWSIHHFELLLNAGSKFQLSAQARFAVAIILVKKSQKIIKKKSDQLSFELKVSFSFFIEIN